MPASSAVPRFPDTAAFEAEWARCSGWLDAALHRGGDTLTLAEAKARVQEGLYQFWPGLDAAAVTQLCRGGEILELNVLLGGGNMATLRAMLPAIEQFGRDAGCSLITVLGRLGWQRSFLTAERGYKPIAVLLGKPLNEQGTEDTHQ